MTQPDFRARWEARCIEAMAKAMVRHEDGAFLAWFDLDIDTRKYWRESARAAFRAFQEAMWMEIGEAPKDDGCPLILALANDHAGAEQIIFGQWDGPDYQLSMNGGWCDHEWQSVDPTHAMPLPLPPKGGEGE